MHWYQEDEYEDEEEDLMFSPAILHRRASESWIVDPPVEVYINVYENLLLLKLRHCLINVQIEERCLITVSL